MSTNVYPRVIERLFRLMRRKPETATEKALERSTDPGHAPEQDNPSNTEEILARAAQSNDTGKKTYKKGD